MHRGEIMCEVVGLASISGGVCPCTRHCEAVEQNSPLVRGGAGFRFMRGDVLWENGDSATDLVVVCIGVLKLESGGGSVVLDLIGRGGLVGICATCPNTHHTTRCVALTDGKGIRMRGLELQERMGKNPLIGQSLLSLQVARAERFAVRTEEIATGTSMRRLARVLSRLCQELSLPDARGRFIPLRLTRADLAGMVGCREETIIRVMTRWRREGLITDVPEGLLIREPVTLSSLAVVN